jgi:hypothetical protein
VKKFSLPPLQRKETTRKTDVDGNLIFYVDLKRSTVGHVEWINLAQGRDQWLILAVVCDLRVQ